MRGVGSIGSQSPKDGIHSIMENKMESTIMENQMEKKMENEMDIGILYGLYWGHNNGILMGYCTNDHFYSTVRSVTRKN